jgi:hypothetical protein
MRTKMSGEKGKTREVAWHEEGETKRGKNDALTTEFDTVIYLSIVANNIATNCYNIT